MKTFNTFLTAVFCLFSVCAMATQSQTSMPVQYEEIAIGNSQTEEPLTISVWYPNAQEPCKHARICLADSVQQNHGVIVSHGAMGSARELNWLGYAFASQGVVVVGVNHYGESYMYGHEHVQPSRVAEVWRRPLEMSYVLDVLEANRFQQRQLMSNNIDWSNSTAAGFSSGGATVISLAGATLNAMQALHYCDSAHAKGDLGCNFVREGVAFKTIPAEFGLSYKDLRIQRVLSLDPAIGPLAELASLQAIQIPTLIIGAVQNDYLPFNNHAAHYAKHISSSKLIGLNNGEGHFVFIDSCDGDYESQGVAICRDRQGVDRDAVKQQLYPQIFDFIYRNI